MTQIINTPTQLAALKRKNKFLFIPSGPGGKVIYPVTVTIISK
jgi:hypothetical protein